MEEEIVQEKDREVYITHTCKNSTLPPLTKRGTKTDKVKVIQHPDYCFRGFIDVDRYNSQSPPKYKYCPECEKKGFKNKRTKKNGMSPEQIEAFKIRMKEYRENKKKESDS